jgi:TrmH RNA methyltransferase
LGAIIRSAAFFDVSLVIISEGDPEAKLTTSAYRVAEGGMEHVKIHRVHDTAAFLRDASRHLVSIGAERRARQKVRDLSVIIQNQRTRFHSNAGRPGIAVVLGNEETGLPQEVKDNCTVLARIPGTGLMDSLNVAQAAALFLHEIFEL